MRGERFTLDLLKRQKPPFVFLDGSHTGGDDPATLLFSDFEAILVFRHGDDPERFFLAAQAWQQKKRWLCGYFTYEFGYYLDEAQQSLRRPFGFPLVWLGVCKKPRHISVATDPLPAELRRWCRV